MANPQKPRAKREGFDSLGKGVDQVTVNVKFIYANGHGTVTFPDAHHGNVVMASQPQGQTAKITFKLTSDSTPGASLSDITFATPPPAGLFDQRMQGADLILDDHNHLPAGSNSQEYTYHVVVNHNGSPYVGDPKIKNDPSSGPVKD
jgi:hypothetical protein